MIPSAGERTWVHEAYTSELLKGLFRDETRVRFVELAERMAHDELIDAIVLGGTELPLLLRESEIGGVPALDTTALHVDAIIVRLRDGKARE